jgi:myo-inositol-1(or 4)-monophosphatase
VADVDLHALLDLASGLARRAGVLLRDRRPDDLDVQSKTTLTDAVTVMDHRAEELIVDGLLSARPDDGILGEEGGGRPGTSGVRWFVDPIDGTVNYLYDLPGYAVSIGAEVDDEVRVGVVLDVAHDELYAAVAGHGATCNGHRIHCGNETDLRLALIGTGFAYASETRARQAEVLRMVLPRVRDIRRLGAAALDLCLVGRGRLDGFYERGLSAWDFSAGALIAREAGATVGGEARGLAVAASPALFDALSELLEKAGA